MISGALDLRALFPGSLRRALVLIFMKGLFLIFPSYPARFIKGCRDSGALTIYTNHPGGNFRSKYSVLQLVQAQNGKITNDVLISI